MTIKELKEILNDLQERVNECDDNENVRVVSNTYFLGYSKYFLGIAGSYGGYINFDRLTDDEEE